MDVQNHFRKVSPSSSPADGESAPCAPIVMLSTIHLIRSVCRWRSKHLSCWKGVLKHHSLQRWVQCFDSIASIWLAQMVALYVFLTRERSPARWHVLRCAVITLVICAQSAPSVQIRSIYFCSLAKSDATHFWNWCPLTSWGLQGATMRASFFFFFWYTVCLVQRCILTETLCVRGMFIEFDQVVSSHPFRHMLHVYNNLYMLINTVNTIISTTHFILHSILHVTMSLFKQTCTVFNCAVFEFPVSCYFLFFTSLS